MRIAWWIVCAGCVVNNGPVGPRPTGPSSGGESTSGTETATTGAPTSGAPTSGGVATTASGAAPGTLGGGPGLSSATGGGCFGGYWRGISDAAGARSNIKLYLQQSGNQLSGRLEFHGYEGHVATEQLAGTADCTAETATINVSSSTAEKTDLSASTYSLKLVHTPGYPLRFEGSFPCKDSHCPGEIKGELQK